MNIILISFPIAIILLYFFLTRDPYDKELSKKDNNFTESYVKMNQQKDQLLLEDIPRTEFVNFIINFLKINTAIILKNVETRRGYSESYIKLTDQTGFCLLDSKLIITDIGKTVYDSRYYAKNELMYDLTLKERITLAELIKDNFNKNEIALENQKKLKEQQKQRAKEQEIYDQIQKNKDVIILSQEEIAELEALDNQKKELDKIIN